MILPVLKYLKTRWVTLVMRVAACTSKKDA